jgi:N-hydroxyarylamine O-acetyltransferase
MVDVAAYLARLGYCGARAPSASVLADLHLAHLLAVPFENLSIHTGEAIELSPAWLFDKIVRRGRGGFCYELNGLFAELCAALGFAVERLAARVCGRDGALGIPFDHMCLRVIADGAAFLADVGFGDNFVRPLRLDVEGPQHDGRRTFRIETDGTSRVLRDDGAPRYRFDLIAYDLADFEPGCRYHQTSPESHFTRRRIASRLTPDGRLTLGEDRLITTGADGTKRERPVAPDDWSRVAAEQFGLRAF